MLGYGGIQYCNRMAVQALCEAAGLGAEVHVLSRTDGAEALAEAVGTPCFGGGSRVNMVGRLLRLTSCQQWDALLLMHVNLAPVLPLCPRLPPVLVMLYGIDVWRPLSWASRWGLRRATELVSISQHTWRTAKAHNSWIAKLPHSICHLGAPPAADAPAATDACPEDGSYALTIGRMAIEERSKGFTELIEVWPRLQNSRPGLKLILIGDGVYRAGLEARSRRVGANVRFLGRVDDATRDRYLRHCTCFCLPSRIEGFGLVYLEAMRRASRSSSGPATPGARSSLTASRGGPWIRPMPKICSPGCWT